MKPVVRVNLVSSQPWVEFINNEAKYVVLERETKNKNAFVLTEGRMEVIWKICNSEHVTHTERWSWNSLGLREIRIFWTLNSQRDISHLDKQTVEGAAGAVASIIAASFLNQWILGYQSFTLTYLDFVKDTSPYFSLTITAFSGSLTDWWVHNTDLPDRAKTFMHRMQRGWLFIMRIPEV